MKYFVTGAAGFIGSNMVDRLLGLDHAVIGYDNLSTGRRDFLADAQKHASFSLVVGDMLDTATLEKAIAGSEVVLHFAANADVRFGALHPTRDLHQNTIATVNLLEAMRKNGIRTMGFMSTGAVYGESKIVPTPEDAPLSHQTSLYAASKLAAEGFIQAYAEAFGFRCFIFRNVSILGERYTHGHVYDFVRQLRENPEKLEVLGDGSQRKAYLYVQDCIDGILCAMSAPGGTKTSVYNLGVDVVANVKQSIGWICEQMNIHPQCNYAGGERGWVGDNPLILLDCSRVRALGWKPKLSVREGVVRTVQFLERNPWVFDR
jgi:UDP-glucose 4-epimerase